MVLVGGGKLINAGSFILNGFLPIFVEFHENNIGWVVRDIPWGLHPTVGNWWRLGAGLGVVSASSWSSLTSANFEIQCCRRFCLGIAQCLTKLSDSSEMSVAAGGLKLVAKNLAIHLNSARMHARVYGLNRV